MKKNFNETKFGSFINKVAATGLDVVSIVGKAKSGNILEAISDTKTLLSKKPNTESDSLLSELIKKKSEFKSDFELYLEDVKDARDMYENTSHVQGDKIADIVIKYNLPIIAVLVLINIVAVFQLRQYQGMVAIISNFIGITISQLFSERQSVINFFFGSSKGSKDKDIKLGK